MKNLNGFLGTTAILILTQLLLVAHCCLGDASNSMSESEIQSSIQATIKVRHPHDTGDYWRSLGPKAPHIIISMYQNNTNIYEQIRLVDALAWYDDSEATKFLKKESEANSNRQIQSAAIRALGISQGVKESEFIKRSLQSNNSQKRVEAARALARVQDPETNQTVEKFLENEPSPWIRRNVESHIYQKTNKNTVIIHRNVNN